MSPLIAIAATLFPEIIKAIAGDRAGTVADRVTRAVTDSVKTKDPVQAQQQLAQNPQVAESLREKLAQIALEETKVRLDDEQRQREAALADLKIRAEALSLRGISIEEAPAQGTPGKYDRPNHLAGLWSALCCGCKAVRRTR